MIMYLIFALKVIFYGLPEHPYFYHQILNYMSEGEGGAPASLSFFTKYDVMALERIVGTSRYKTMIGGAKDTYMFC
jgi:U3 small nucleolar RNA-associated protein 25